LLLTDYGAYCEAVHDQPDSFIDTGLSYSAHPCGCLRPGYSGTRPDGSFMSVPVYVGGGFIDHPHNRYRAQRREQADTLRSVLGTLGQLPWFRDLAAQLDVEGTVVCDVFDVARALCEASPRAAHAVTDQLARQGYPALAASLSTPTKETSA